MKKNKITAMLLSGVLLLCMTACGESGGEPAASKPPAQEDASADYREDGYYSLPDTGFHKQDTLKVTSVERGIDGRPAMYLMEGGRDDEGDIYAQILEYTLNSKGEWDMKVLDPKSLTKRVKGLADKGFDIPFISRGDDGNLYALLRVGGGGDNGEGGPPEYSVLLLNEEKDSFYENALRLDSEQNGDIKLEKEEVLRFHVLEDGTPFLVFKNGTAVQFDPDDGTEKAVCAKVPDRAFDKSVGYGENEFVYYAAAKKSFSILDLETMTVARQFGEEIDEQYKGKEWFFDTETENWQMYAFNFYGLYRISQSAKNASAIRLSTDGAFNGLDGCVIYDVLVDTDENVYVLIRKEGEDSSDYDGQWDFGILKYSRDKSAAAANTSSPA